MICKNIKYDLIKDYIGSIPLKDAMDYKEVEEVLGLSFHKHFVYHAYMKGMGIVVYSKKSVMLFKREGNGLHDFHSRKDNKFIMRED